MQALTLAFLLEFATSNKHIGAILLQDHGKGWKPIAYGSQVVSNVEMKFSPCE